jgi:uncharacterized protein
MSKLLPHVDELTRPFWDAVQLERLLLQRCGACERWVWHPRAWCPHCYSGVLRWCGASGRGQVYTYSVVHYAPLPGYAQEVPYVLATVRLDEGVQMMTNIVGCPCDAVHVGQAVQVCFETREGGFKVPQFMPVAAALAAA